ncbi:MAG: lysoplasmalogenase [Promethearchaeota archaeon]
MIVYSLFILPFIASVSFINLVGNLKKSRKIIVISKPLIVPLIILYHVMDVFHVNWFLIVGLLFGWFGDILLLDKEKKSRFLLGLLSFLAGHIFYILGFAFTTKFVCYDWWLLLIVIPYVIFSYFIYQYLKNELAEMKLPTLIYIVVICVMSVFAFFRMSSSTPISFGFIYIGSVLFIVSDTMIAINYFKKQIRNSEFFIMLTYILAQLMIATGFSI